MRTLASLIAVGAVTTFSAIAQPSLTIYNQDFAVVRDIVALDLKSGTTEVRFSNATAQVEPDSVILRDPNGKHLIQILEQNYRNDPVSQELLLSLNEGKAIDFQVERMKDNTTVREIIPGKVIRSGFVPGGGAEQPIIEVDGKLRFGLPGQPLFPALGDDTVLKPTFNWLIQSTDAGKFDAEVGYVTGGFTWEADYNLVAPETGDTVDIIGWITMHNESGTTFRDAKIKLMAGDVQKVRGNALAMIVSHAGGGGGEPAVSEKTFDEFHLYTIARPTTLRNHETKQVEFVRAEHVKAPVSYIYDGLPDMRFTGQLNDESYFGAGEGNKKVAVMREFVNTQSNHLGIALPAGEVRFYRSDTDKRLEFTGEDHIGHTPRQETVRVKTGNAFDLVAERKRTEFKVHLVGSPVDQVTGLPVAPIPTNDVESTVDEAFEIRLRNRKKEPVTVTVVEHLYRWNNWNITAKSDDFTKKDAQTIEFNVPVAADQEKVVTYTVHYSW